MAFDLVRSESDFFILFMTNDSKTKLMNNSFRIFEYQAVKRESRRHNNFFIDFFSCLPYVRVY